ncbi:hypothetical protein RJ640_028083 [Escallonia rubra]|uniref:Transcription factor GTE8 n=1 Tax=Escallonia rubra TaxID=112253 RepID=A0AA88QN17_9ASTE|nr:hypothetical protein RJ640_028083 [Escallonia rubra]
MEHKERFPEGRYTGFQPNGESEVSGSSGRTDMEIGVPECSSAPGRNSISLNPVLHDSYGVPLQVIPLLKLSHSERKGLVRCLRAELEQIRALQKKTRVVSKAEPGFPSSKISSLSKLTRRPGETDNAASCKGRGWNRGTSGKFESATQTPETITSYAMGMKQCENMLKNLMSHKHGWVFNEPVDVVKLNLPDYLTVIKHPMDLGTIRSKIATRQYSSPLEFIADVRLTFANAMTYNPPGNDVHVMAGTLSKIFEARCKNIEKKLPVNNSLPWSDESGLVGERDMVKPNSPIKKRKIDSTQYEMLPEPVKLVMTAEDKQKLRRELEASIEDLPDNIVEFLRKQCSHGKKVEEIEVDIDDLSDDTLLTLRKLLDVHLRENQNLAKAEPCEIELPIESGLSNSSMQLDGDNGLVDDDVDIGGNESPVSNYPPVVIEKDVVAESNKDVTTGAFNGDLGTDSGSSYDDELGLEKASIPVMMSKASSGPGADSDQKEAVGSLVDGNQSVSGLDQLEQIYQQNPISVDSDYLQDGESAPVEMQVSPEKLYRVALLKNRFADTILKAQEMTLNQGGKGDPERMLREREELELQRKKEKARLQAEAKAAEAARRQAEVEAAAEARQRREIEREAARQALLKMEKTVEINGSSRFLEDLEMLRTVPPEQLPSSVDETSPDHSEEDGLGSFKFGSNNPLEQLGLYMKMDDEEEEGEPPSIPNFVDEVEEGEID